MGRSEFPAAWINDLKIGNAGWPGDMTLTLIDQQLWAYGLSGHPAATWVEWPCAMRSRGQTSISTDY